jgi:FkbM family methyltransferase
MRRSFHHEKITFLLFLCLFGPLALAGDWSLRPNRSHLFELKERAAYSLCVVDVANHLPIAQDGSISVHHWDSIKTRSYWNDYVRWQNLSLTKDSVVVDVGGHRTGLDTQMFHNKFACRIHVFEPVPAFCAELASALQGRPTINVNCVGIGRQNRTFFIDETQIKEQSTFLAGGNGHIPITIVDAAHVFSALTQDFPLIDVVNANCEGCEWELFPRLITFPEIMKRVRRFQFSFHNYGASDKFGERFALYCRIRVGLTRTHNPMRVMPFGWEVWTLKE